MGRSSALLCALDLLHMPKRAGMMRSRPLPEGIGELLAILAGDAGVLESASSRFGFSQNRLREAADFFVCQVMFAPDADAYRLLGCSAGDDKEKLRAHVALLLRWLHPDAADGGRSPQVIRRVTSAWNDIKTAERRAVYDKACAERVRAVASKPAPAPGVLTGPPPVAAKRMLRRRAMTRRHKFTAFLARLFSISPQPN